MNTRLNLVKNVTNMLMIKIYKNFIEYYKSIKLLNKNGLDLLRKLN